ncbi:MAG: LAGLIDADG homing endonuclease [Candidatus Daviesbacteria bacterium GW2011_GWA1_41_61]|nr:MAG: LAGLIDADG homing endonuclease [Candidatus Daviesbacteria bacterium GW2011_GWB1_41_15]KKS14561.1 MAG: LAGLIDADG homing endonuclease [Candidatus Daviesbacteria bacterium GW2011_GWA1_41_61]
MPNSTDNVTSADNQQERLKMIGWIVGFVDGEGCFSISVFKNRTTRSKFQVFPEFVVTQGQKSLASLEAIKNFFGCGAIYVNRRYDNHKENIYRYCVRSFKDLKEIIIPFFKENQLKTCKKKDFEILCKAVDMKLKNIHLTAEGLQKFKDLKNPQRLIRRTPILSEKIESELYSDIQM